MDQQNTPAQQTMHASASGRLFEFARVLRKEMTPAESTLWEEIRNKKIKGYKFRRQHPVGEYIIDFYCHKLTLGIEVDGSIHTYGDNKQYDDFRTSFLHELGIRIIRFSNEDVLSRMNNVLGEIKHLIPGPSPEGEGNSSSNES